MKKNFKYIPLEDEVSVYLPSENTTTELRIESGSPPTVEVNIRPNGAKYCWSKWLVFGHILTLYITVIILYVHVKNAEENLTQYNLNSINISLKNMQIEMYCLQEIGSLRKLINDHMERRNHVNNLREHRIIKRDLSLHEMEEGELGSSLDVGLTQLKAPRTYNNDNERNIKGRRGNRKRNRKTTRRHCHSSHTPLVANFKGAIPEPTIRDGGIIHPWFKDKESAGEFNLHTNFTSTGKEMIEIVEGGLYFIHAQVYYHGRQVEQFSFRIMLIPKDSDNNEKGLAYCSSVGSGRIASEMSCYTSVIRNLSPGDRLFIKQREKDVYITMRPGETFFSLVLLNKRP